MKSIIVVIAVLFIGDLHLTNAENIVSLFRLCDPVKNGNVNQFDVERVHKFLPLISGWGADKKVQAFRNAISNSYDRRVNEKQFDDLLKQHTSIPKYVDLDKTTVGGKKYFTREEVIELTGNTFTTDKHILKPGPGTPIISNAALATYIETTPAEQKQVIYNR